MFGLRSSARCVFTVSVAVFVVSRCCCCCCNVLGRIFACFIVSALSLGPRSRPLPPCAMRVPMFLILYIDIWPPGCQKREPLPKVDCGSLSEARSVGGGSKRRGRRRWRGRRMPIAIDWAWVDVVAVAVVVGGNFALEICMICATPFVMHLF